MKLRKHLLLALLGLWTAGTAAGRETYNINRDWQFSAGYEIVPDAYTTVTLPHTWNTDARSGGNYYIGMGSYIKHLAVPAAWADKKVYIRFKGANSTANLFVNGKHVGEHEGAFTAFTFDITPYLNFGQTNSVMVNVSNALSLTSMPVMGLFNTYGGLYRDVDLIVTEPDHISLTDYSSDGVYLRQREVTPERASVEAVVKVNLRSEGNMAAEVEVLDGDRTVFQGRREITGLSPLGRAEVAIPFSIENPRLWNGVYDPFLYTVRVRVVDARKNTVTDEVTVPLGLRFFEADGREGFLLNGEPYPLRGVVRHQDRAVYGGALQPAHNEEDMAFIEELGANAVRLAEGPHDPYFYDLADRKGIVIWSQLPFLSPRYVTGNGYINARPFKENGERQLVEMIRQLYNHPSVLMWGLFDEINLRGDDPLDYITQLNSTAHYEDPSRLTVGASNQDGEINFITDLIAWNQYFGWNQGAPSDIAIWSDGIRDHWLKKLKPGLSGYGAGANVYHQEDSLRKPAAKGPWHPERWQTYLHEEYFRTIQNSPYLWGTFANSLFDYGDVNNTYGGSRGIDGMGLVTFSRHTKKDAFYFYKANWNQHDPFVYLAEKRWDKRRSPRQDIKVYSNLESVELWVNGRNLGENASPVNGTFLWKNVTLRPGANEIVARSGRWSDYARIEVLPSPPVQ